jgi:UDP-glucose 4-epimerase
MTTTVVVTGASGFIGRAVVNLLRAESDFHIIPVSRSKSDLGVKLVEDYRNTPYGDVLIHLAENPDRAEVNRLGDKELQNSIEMLDSLIHKDYQFVLYSSSAVLYGEKSAQPYLETSPVDVLDIYSRLKLLNEERVLNSGGSVVRLANVIGPRMAQNNVLSDILSQLSGNGSISVRNSGPTRDFIWVNDAARAILGIVKREKGGIYNVGTGKGVTIEKLILLELEASGQEHRDVISVTPPDYQSSNVVDISKIYKDIGWRPLIDIKASIKMLLDGR